MDGVRDLGERLRWLGHLPQAEFQERIGRVRAHCDDFQPLVYELVTEVS